jgi:hypothetical protein
VKRIGLSVYIPLLVLLHLGIGRGIRVSRCCGSGWLAHYGGKKRSMGRSERNLMNIWGHFDPKSSCMGFSKHKGLLILHYDANGDRMGFSLVLGILLLHFLKK